MPLAAAIAQHVPIEARIVPGALSRQVGCWILYWGVVTVPFFLGAAAVGLALMLAPQRTGAVYGANLIGSAAGALGAPVAMAGLPPQLLPLTMGLVAFAGAAVWLTSARRAGAFAACVVVVGGWLWLDRPRVRIDPYKYQAYIDRMIRGPRSARTAARSCTTFPFCRWTGRRRPSACSSPTGTSPGRCSTCRRRRKRTSWTGR
jgi:hypothetical protein